MMWKVFLSLACVACLTVVSSDAQDSDLCPGQNEFYDTCISGCSNQTCATIGKVFHCPIQTTVCKTGCRCKPNFYRNTDNICVSESECDSSSDGTDNLSGSMETDATAQESIDTDTSENSNFKNGDLSSSNNDSSSDGTDNLSTSVESDTTAQDSINKDTDTPENSNFENGTLSSSNNGASNDDTNNGSAESDDVAQNSSESDGCTGVQNGCGGDPNAHSGCGVNCGKTCSTYKAKHPKCPRICKVGGCDCNDGFVLDSNVGKCVLPQECTPICGLNEQFDSCTNGGCGHRNCSQLGQPEICIKRTPESCTKGCVCVQGYLRAANGTCVPQDQCPKPGCSGDPNAHSGCGVNCGKTCSTYKAKHPICPRICKVGGCDCNDGFVFDSNVGKCVLPQECTPICGFNEQFDACTNGGCGHRNCSQLGQPEICIRRTPESCTKGCVCIQGYLRATNGTCVPQDQCPKPGCSGDPNAHSGCGVNCGKTCSTYKAKHPICPRICKVGGCDCNDGFVFDSNVGKCVLPQECTPICGFNEQFDACTNGGCGHRNCSQLGQPEICIRRTPESCTKGCVCIQGYLRATNGTCVPQDQCPKPECGGDPNAHSGCGVNCGKTCSTYKAKHPICPRICKVGGCDCNDGFVLDSNVGKCVLPQECTPICGFNEQFDACTNGGCGHRNCSQLGQPEVCIRRTPESCTKGCVCIQGYLRAANGTCVPQDQCPKPGCGGDPNAHSGCGVNCGKTCSTYKIKHPVCPAICRLGGCDCNVGFVFDGNVRKCVLPQKCTPICGLNEQFDSCTNGGCGHRNCSQLGQPQICIDRTPESCTKGCVCIPGYLRAANRTCVPQDQCHVSEPNTTTAPATTTTTEKSPSTDSGDNNGGTNKNGLESLQAGVTRFNGKFLYDRMKASQGENIITSPYSVFTPLAQLALYADGDSLKQLTGVLNLSDKQDIRSSFPALVASFDGQTSVNFSTAAKVYSNKQYPLSDGFKKDSVDVFHAEAQELDFSKSSEAAHTINAWVENKTNDRIKDLIASSDLSSLTRIVLVNAIYFKGDWLYLFDKANTKDADFYLSDGTTKKTKLMYQEAQFNYGEDSDLNCKILEMPYKGKNFTMVIVLPNEKDGIMKTAEALQNEASFNKVLEGMTKQKVQVYVPPFEINTETDLADILKEEGITKIFDQANSGLSGMLQKPEEIYVSKAIQKAFIKVDETGSEAAAANGFVGSARPGPPPPPPTVFRADHAFLFYLRVHTTTIFCGTYIQ